MVPDVEHKRLRSFDGTDIAYQVRGAGPAVVLANGLGGTYASYRSLYEALGDSHRLISWHYRGLYDSGRPPGPDALSMNHQVRDLLALLDAEKVESAVIVGWSMGVQVAFETFREHAHRIGGLVALNGTAGRPFDTALGLPGASLAIRPALRAARWQGRRSGQMAKRVVGLRGFLPALKAMGLVGRAIDEQAFMDVAHGVASQDWDMYCGTLEHLGDHDAFDVLSRVDIPVLIVTGDRDRMTPVKTAHRMRAQLPSAKLVVIPGGSHYTLVEFPDVVVGAVVDYLDSLPDFRRGAA